MNTKHATTLLLQADGFVLRPLVPPDAPAMAAAVRESMASLGPWMPWAHTDYDEAMALDWIAGCASARADGSAHEFGIFRRRDATVGGGERAAGRIPGHGADGAPGNNGDSDGSTSSDDGLDYVGNAGLNQFNRAHHFCNLGYWVRASAQRQGAGLAAIRALACFAFEALGQARVEIVVADGNLPSLALARRAGAVHECLARNRLTLHGRPVAAHVLSLVPDATPTRPASPLAPARR